MESFTLEDLRGYLQAVRGETRVKAKEESIRNRFLQTALTEVFREHDWPFNEETVTLEPEASGDYEGLFKAPDNFSSGNDWTLGVGLETYTKLGGEVYLYMDKTTGAIYFKGVIGTEGVLTYFIKAPDLTEDSASVAFFPEPMLVAERGYVRLKTAYFPDESSKEEFAANRLALRRLYTDSIPKQDFTHRSWG